MPGVITLKDIQPFAILSNYHAKNKKRKVHFSKGEIADDASEDIIETNVDLLLVENGVGVKNDNELYTEVQIDEIDDEDNQKKKTKARTYGASELSHARSKKAMNFIDPNKEKIRLWVNMVDIYTNGALPRYTTKKCFGNCRSKFKSHPIGCPLRYNCISEDKSSKVSKLDRERIVNKFKEANLPDDTTDFFETEGIFCTFPCIKAYILDQLSRTKSPKYKKSLTLLTLLYLKLVGVICTIPTAGSWKLTTDWGGHMSPPEYRSTTGLLEYTETVNIRRPYMFCSSNWIREKRIKQ